MTPPQSPFQFHNGGPGMVLVVPYDMCETLRTVSQTNIENRRQEVLISISGFVLLRESSFTELPQ